VRAPTLLACLLVGLAVNGLGATAMLVPNAVLATGLLTLAFFGMMSGPVFALSIIGEIVPVHLRGRFTAITMVSIGLVTQGAGPFLVGFSTDHLFRAPDGLGAALCCVWLTSMIVGGALLASALGKYPRVALTPATVRSVQAAAPQGSS
jgi:MFS family permease